MKKHIWIAGALMVLFSSCNDFLDYNENSDYDQNSVFNITWSNEDFVTGITNEVNNLLLNFFINNTLF